MAGLGITLADLIHRIEEAGPGAPAIERLQLAVDAARDLTALSDALLGHFVDECRDDAASWTQIGEVLGVSKQGAQQRFVPARSPDLSRWTPRARGALEHAAKEAGRLGQGVVGTEHLLLGVCKGENLAVTALDGLGIEAKDLRRAVTARVDKHAPAAPEGFTPQARRALELTLRESLRLGHNYVGTEHLLIALADGEGTAAELLHEAGVDADRIRREVLRLLARYPL